MTEEHLQRIQVPTKQKEGKHIDI